MPPPPSSRVHASWWNGVPSISLIAAQIESWASRMTFSNFARMLGDSKGRAQREQNEAGVTESRDGHREQPPKLLAGLLHGLTARHSRALHSRVGASLASTPALVCLVHNIFAQQSCCNATALLLHSSQRPQGQIHMSSDTHVPSVSTPGRSSVTGTSLI